MSETAVKIRAEGVYKLFGERQEEALEKLEAGAGKDEVYRETGAVAAVRDVSFEVGEGEIFVVMGLSGSGKSTLIRCINRLIRATEGRIEIDGNDVLAMDDAALRELRLHKMSMVFQHFALFPHKTVGENVEYGLKIQGVDAEKRRKKALDALGQVGLRDWADTPPANLSGGMQQRVGLARGLAVDPEILLMDEPFSALDPLIRRDMQSELIDLQERIGMSILFITHDLNEALRLGDRIAIMKDGAFVQVGPPEEIVAEPADDYVMKFTQDVDRGRVFTARTVMREPQALRAGEAGASDVAERMRDLERDALFLTDAEDRPVGVVTAADLGDGDGVALDSVTREKFSEIRHDDRLLDVFPLCADGLPLAVVDEDRRLRGVVHPLDLFAVLAVDEDEEGAAQDEDASIAGDGETHAA